MLKNIINNRNKHEQSMLDKIQNYWNKWNRHNGDKYTMVDSINSV